VRFKLDENLPRAARAVLEARGWDVHDVHEEGLASALDAVIRDACEREDRVLVTRDTDFSDVLLVHPATSPGIILLRPPDQSIKATVANAFRCASMNSYCEWTLPAFGFADIGSPSR
jgi:predicted nuclease of predicted toxin-antitoxin system